MFIKGYRNNSSNITAFQGNLMPATCSDNGPYSFLQLKFDKSNNYGDSLELSKAIYKDLTNVKNGNPVQTELTTDTPQVLCYTCERGEQVALDSLKSEITLRGEGDSILLQIFTNEGESHYGGFLRGCLGKETWMKETSAFFKKFLEKTIKTERTFNDELFATCINLLKDLKGPPV